MINIVLFGAPGCGKGTQAQRLKAHYGIEHVSTGEVIRDEIRRGTELGRSMESYIKAGKLAPDEIVIGMVANYVSEHKHVKGCIFDGFPRTTVQAEEFDKLLARHGLKVDIMVDIHVPEEELVQRILLRGKDSGRADDASEEVLRGRPPKPGANPVPGSISIPFPAAGRGPAPPVSGSGGKHAPALSPSLRPLSVHPGLTPAAESAQRYGDKTEKKVRGFAILQIIRIFATPLRDN